MSLRLVLAAAAVATVALAAVGCGSSTPVSPDGAWNVSFGPTTTPGQCLHAGGNVTETIGTVSANSIGATETDGTSPANEDGPVQVECTVTGTSTFSVTATAKTAAKVLSITIPSISASATSTSPAMGSVLFESAQYTSDNSYGGACSFYFQGGHETVASGKIWGTFACPSLQDEGQSDFCAINESYFIFENCSM